MTLIDVARKLFFTGVLVLVVDAVIVIFSVVLSLFIPKVVLSMIVLTGVGLMFTGIILFCLDIILD